MLGTATAATSAALSVDSVASSAAAGTSTAAAEHHHVLLHPQSVVAAAPHAAANARNAAMVDGEQTKRDGVGKRCSAI